MSETESNNLVSSSNKKMKDDLNDKKSLSSIDLDFARNWTLKELKGIYKFLHIYAYSVLPELEEKEYDSRSKKIFNFIYTRFVLMSNTKEIKLNGQWKNFSEKLILSTNKLDKTKSNLHLLYDYLLILMIFSPQKKEEVLFIMKSLLLEFNEILENSHYNFSDELKKLGLKNMKDTFSKVSEQLGIALTDKNYELLHSKSLILEERLSNIM